MAISAQSRAFELNNRANSWSRKSRPQGRLKATGELACLRRFPTLVLTSSGSKGVLSDRRCGRPPLTTRPRMTRTRRMMRWARRFRNPLMPPAESADNSLHARAPSSDRKNSPLRGAAAGARRARSRHGSRAEIRRSIEGHHRRAHDHRAIDVTAAGGKPGRGRAGSLQLGTRDAGARRSAAGARRGARVAIAVARFGRLADRTYDCGGRDRSRRSRSAPRSRARRSPTPAPSRPTAWARSGPRSS